MKRFISKIDYDMQMLLQERPDCALELWKKIKDRSVIIDGALEIVEDKETHQKRFYAPAICHMILANKEDIDAEKYHRIAINVIKNSDLNRLTVVNDISFLDLIIQNGLEDLDEFFIRFINSEIFKREREELLRYVDYDIVLKHGAKVLSYKDDTLDIKLSSSEVNSYSNTDYMTINNKNTQEELEYSAFERRIAAKRTRRKLS